MIKEIKKEIQDTAMSSALNTFLSEWDGDPSEVFDAIEGGELDHVLVWEPFEDRNAEDLGELIGTHYDCEIANYKEVVAKVKRYLVSRAVNDSLPMDMNELDLSVLF